MWRHVNDILAIQTLWRVWANSWAASFSFQRWPPATKPCQTCRDSARSVFQTPMTSPMFRGTRAMSSKTQRSILQQLLQPCKFWWGHPKRHLVGKRRVFSPQSRAEQRRLQLFCWKLISQVLHREGSWTPNPHASKKPDVNQWKTMIQLDLVVISTKLKSRSRTWSIGRF